VEDDYGFTLARDVAQDMVMYLRRPGGQLQFSRYSLQPSGASGPISDLQAWILQNLTADLCVENLAEKAAMSPRNFTRLYPGRRRSTCPLRNRSAPGRRQTAA
jgi:transcriptional regulator GlxA family with amidase domain